MVLKLGLSPQYVLDEIEFYEINALLKYQYYRVQEEWEQTRFLGFITAKSHGSKLGKLDDLIKFQWEKKSKEKPTFMTESDYKRLRDKAQWLIDNNMIANNQNG